MSSDSFNCDNPVLSETHCIEFTLSLDIVLLALSSSASLLFSFQSLSGQHNNYTANFQLQVIVFAESTNNSRAARRFSVNKKLVRDWKKMQNVLFEMSTSFISLLPQLYVCWNSHLELLKLEIYIFFFNYFVLFRL